MAVLTLRYDLRALGPGHTTHPDLYAACLEQAAWGDEKGLGNVVISEHHASDDGYLPSPLVMGAAIAGRTKNIMISVAALLVPLHDPLRLAEDIAVLDILSGGRVSIIAGLGYRPQEFEMFGVDRSRRGKVMEENLEVMLQAWTGKPFEYRGTTVRVTPVPLTKPHPLMLVGGSTEAAARRAAKFHLGFMPAIGDPKLAEVYAEACREAGFEGGFTILPAGPGFVHVSEDPERDWERIAPYALHEARTYSSWQTPGQRSQVDVHGETLDDVKASGVYRVVTPDECVALADEVGPMGGLILHPLMGGMPPELGWESLELFASKVLPRLQAG